MMKRSRPPNAYNSSLPNRSQRLARAGPIKPKKRKASEFVRVYGSCERVHWLHRQPCVVTGQRGNIECVHVRTGGTGRKADACWTVPMSSSLHRELHTLGIRSFSAKYDIDLELAAIATNQAWLAHCARFR